MSADLEERLKSHAKAFDGLLSLIPAKLYYGEDNTDQWQRKKQTKEQKKAARMAKLDPDNVKTAKDVMDERAAALKKRKRDSGDDGDQSSDLKGDGLDSKVASKQKKQKNTDGGEKVTAQSAEATEDEKKRRKAEKKTEKRERKKAKIEKSKAKRERQKARKVAATSNEPTEGQDSDDEESDVSEDDGEDMVEAIDIEPTSEPLKDTLEPSTASPSPSADEVLDSPKIHSTSSSISSIQPPTTAEAKPESKPDSTDNKASESTSKLSAEDVRARLQARIEALRNARKADGPNGQPARSRQELLEARRKKEEERKAHKKELRQKAKEDEARQQDEEITKRFSPGGSGSLLASPRSPMTENNSFSFGRVAFGDGTHADTTLSTLLDPVQKKKGASDARSALNAAEQKAARLAALDPEKRKEIEQKDMWLNARKRAHGEKLKDDTSLLKKALKRQEGRKNKSEKEWKGRTEDVQKGIHMRQKKREENLKKRKDGKGSGGGKKGGKSGGGGKVKRPGFEGSFKAKHGGGGGKK